MPRHGSRAGKGSKSSKTARVLGLIADPSAAREDHGAPAESPSQQRLDDRATQEDIHSALEQELLAQEESRAAAASTPPGGHQAVLSRQGAGSRRAVRNAAPEGEDVPAEPVRARPGRRARPGDTTPAAPVEPVGPVEPVAPVVETTASRQPPRRTPPRSAPVPEAAPVQTAAPVQPEAPAVPVQETAPVRPGAAQTAVPAQEAAPVQTAAPARSAAQRAAIRAGAVSDEELALMDLVDDTSSRTAPVRPAAAQTAAPSRTAAPVQPDAPARTDSHAHTAAVRAHEAVRSHSQPIAEKDPQEFVCYNLTRALVEAQAEKYMRSYGMCMCDRCRVDVEAIALSNLPSKYVAAQNMDLVPLLSMYEKKASAEITAKVMNACQMVKARPHHGR